MSRTKITEDLTEIANLSVYKDKLSLAELKERVTSVTNRKMNRSLEQKIIALRILMLNGMKYTQTGKEVGVTKETLMAWWKKYGETMQVVNPSQEIAQRLENDLAGLMGDVYSSARSTLTKLNALVEKASTARDIYPVVEALRATSELIKIDIEKNKVGGDGTKGLDFYTNVYNTMINNTYGNDGK